MSLQAILSSPNELDDWKRNDLPTDDQALQNALILRSCGNDRTRAWPLLVDPHNQAELWIRALHEGITKAVFVLQFTYNLILFELSEKVIPANFLLWLTVSKPLNRNSASFRNL